MKRRKKTRTGKTLPKKHSVEKLMQDVRDFASYTWRKHSDSLGKIGKTKADIEQLASLQLLRLAGNQDLSKGASLKTRLRTRLDGLKIDLLRQANKKKKLTEETKAIIATLKSSKKAGQKEKIDAIARSLSLTKNERSRFNRAFGFGGQRQRSIKQVAAEERVTEHAVSLSLYKAYQKLAESPEMRKLAGLPRKIEERRTQVHSIQTGYFKDQAIADILAVAEKPSRKERADLIRIIRSTRLGDSKTNKRNQRMVIEWAGLAGMPPKSQKQLSVDYHMDKSRVSQILERAFKRLGMDKRMQAFRKE